MVEQRVDGRSERSKRTRARVVEAATALFVEHGYVAARIEEIAEQAGVAVQTVYYLFGNKRALLAAVLDASIVGDLEPVPVLERPWVARLRDERDPDVAVRLLVAEVSAIVARAAAVYDVIRSAAAQPEVRELLEENLRLRRIGQRALVAVVHDAGHLADGVDLDTAADVFYGIMSEDLYGLLVGECGWSPERYRDWATTLLVDQLVHPGSAGVPKPRRRGRS